MLVWLLLACHTKDLAGCATLGDPIAREECRYDFIKPLLADDPAFKAAIDSVTDAPSRDLVLLRLAVDNPERAQSLCGLVRLPATREKCDKVIGRPHIAGPRPSP